MVYYREPLYQDRWEAGDKLAPHLASCRGQGAVVLAIPLGGVPVAVPVAASLGAKLDLVIPRKLPIPWNPEAGFGAVAADGTVILNEPLVAHLGLAPADIQRVAAQVLQEIKRRRRALRGRRPPPEVGGQTVIIVDDGLASGYTMRAAIASVRLGGPTRVVVAVPVASAAAVEMVWPYADELVCPAIIESWSFAVASFYRRWHDLSDEEARAYLKEYLATRG